MKLNKNYIALDKFIDKALYSSKSGFYMKKNPFGKSGDFITSPNISILFSEMLSIWSVAFWENLNCPKKINLVELGAGNGQMIFDMINSLKKFPNFYNSCNFFILEKSPYLIKIQKKKLKDSNIKWINDLKEIKSGYNIFVANEFFDALPIKQFFKIKNKWTERFVREDKNNNRKFINIPSNIKKLEKKLKLKISKNQTIVEYSPLALRYLEKISKKINDKKGALLIIDYGYISEEMKDTLMGIKRHAITNMLDEIGNTDITYHINFKFLEKVIKNFKVKCQGITTQRKFLIKLGINKRAEMISKKLTFSKKANIYYRLNRLINEKQMGNLFKVMLITHNKINFKIGF